MVRPNQGKMATSRQRGNRAIKISGLLRKPGQALVEYVLIAVFVVMAIIGIIALTGPAVGNIFSNAVINLLQQTWTPYPTLSVEQLGTYIAAVASYTPPPRTPNQIVILPTLAPSDTPMGTPYSSPTATFTKTYTPTATSTYIVPSQTPVDQQFNINTYYQPGTETQWHYDNVTAPSRARFAWNVEYFNSPMTFSGAPVATEILQDHLKFDWGGGSPYATVASDGFSARYTALAQTDPATPPDPLNPGVPFTVGEVWEIRVTGNEFFRVEVDGSPVVTDITAPSADGVVTKLGYYTASTTGIHQVVALFSDISGNASIEVTINRVSDYGDCKWTNASIVSPAGYNRSPNNAWADSQDGISRINYSVNSSCTLRQRGWYDISTMDNPRLIFWNRWKLNTGDSLIVGVRDYGSTDPWLWKRVHTTIGTNFNWNRIVLDLENITGAYVEPTTGGAQGQIGSETVTKDFTGAGTSGKVEIAFRVLSDTANDTEDGWYLDDIGVFEYGPQEVTITTTTPFTDVINTGSQINYVNECTWRVVNEGATGSRSVWWSGSYGGLNGPVNFSSYTGGSDCPLTIDRIFNIPTGSDLPLLEFDSQVRLAAATDQVLVEYSEVTKSGTSPDTTIAEGPWLPLQRLGGTTPYLYQGTNNITWETVKVRLDSDYAGTVLRGKQIMIRFRLLADTDASVASGWFIDNLKVRLNVVSERSLPFIEPFTSTTDWELNGWALTAGSDPVHGLPTALTDSPNGALYQVDVDKTTELIPAIRITGSTKPTISFWLRWQVPNANVRLDFSSDDGISWNQAWQLNKATEGSENKAWYRFEIDLVSVLAAQTPPQTIASAPRLKFRFNIKATGTGVPGDGVYIDDFRIEDLVQTPVTLTAGTEYIEDMDAATSANNWYVGGTWAWANNVGKTNSSGTTTGGWVDSPGTGVPYDKPERSVMEFIQPINTTAASYPAIVFWTKYNFGSTTHALAVDFKPNGGTWTQQWATTDAAISLSTNLAWTRVIVPVNLTAAQQPFKVRIRLEAMDTATAADGVNLDSFHVVDRVAPVWESFDALPPGFDTMSGPSRWILEGDWKVPATGTPANILWGYAEYNPTTLSPVSTTWTGNGYPGAGVTSSGWVGDFYHTNANWSGGTSVNWAALLATTANLPGRIEGGNISFDYGADHVNLPIPPGNPSWTVGGLNNDEWYAIRWRRRLTATTAQTYLFRLEATGGAQVLVGGSVITPSAVLPRPYISTSTTPETATTARRIFYYSVPISGTVDVEVRFLHSTVALTGEPYIDFRIAQPENVARTSAWETRYTHLTRSSLILNGTIKIPAGKTAFVSYRERWSIADTDHAAAWYSTDR
ncbi:MAG: hypothetical protein U0528_15145, partial [Anaerolineae bacterium]